jgi:hypothetical protein
MLAADWAHGNDLSVDQLHPVVFAQNPRLDHLVVFGNREWATRIFD